jgi:hypothetical protein
VLRRHVGRACQLESRGILGNALQWRGIRGPRASVFRPSRPLPGDHAGAFVSAQNPCRTSEYEAAVIFKSNIRQLWS